MGHKTFFLKLSDLFCFFSLLLSSCKPAASTREDKPVNTAQEPLKSGSLASSATQPSLSPAVAPPATPVQENLVLKSNSASADCVAMTDAPGSTAWCNFHYDARHCGVSDNDWISACKRNASNSSESSSNDCGSSPANGTQAWCDFHQWRPNCGISDSDWKAACPVKSSGGAGGKVPDQAQPDPRPVTVPWTSGCYEDPATPAGSCRTVQCSSFKDEGACLSKKSIGTDFKCCYWGITDGQN